MSWKLARRLGQGMLVIVLSLGQAAAQSAAQSHGGFRTWAQAMVDRLALRYGLSESQKQQALVVYKGVEDSSRPLETKIAEQRAALREAVKNNASESQIDQMAGAVGSLTAQLVSIETKGDASFYAVLTPDQRQKWDQPSRGPGRGPGIGPGRGGPASRPGPPR